MNYEEAESFMQDPGYYIGKEYLTDIVFSFENDGYLKKIHRKELTPGIYDFEINRVDYINDDKILLTLSIDSNHFMYTFSFDISEFKEFAAGFRGYFGTKEWILTDLVFFHGKLEAKSLSNSESVDQLTILEAERFDLSIEPASFDSKRTRASN